MNFLSYGRRNYGVLQLTVSSPQRLPVDPMNLDEAKELIRWTTDEEDGLIFAFISAARFAAEKETGYELAVKQYDLTLDYFTNWDVEMPTPLQSVDLVQYRDSDGNIHVMTENVDYVVDLARGLICPLWGHWWPIFTPWPSGAVLIRFTSGYPPAHPFWSNEGTAVMLGMRYLISEWWKVREMTTDSRLTEVPYRAKYLFGLFGRMRIR